jgi:phosphoribosylanthranilate isomerase
VTFVKFCGLTRDADVEAAAALRVDAVGFVLWPDSPRAVSFEDLPALVRRLPPAVIPVGVFVRPTETDVARAIEAGVRAVQIHGVTALPPWPIAADVWIAGALVDGSVAPAVPDGTLLVLDAHDPHRHGGTGRIIDWDAASVVAASRRVLLAGGLTPANVATAIRRVRPFGVDVASGIELQPGVKDHVAMREFATRVHLATSS